MTFQEVREMYIKRARVAFEDGDKNSGEYFTGLVVGLDMAQTLLPLEKETVTQ